jgi:hypothetical protein
MFFPIPGSGDFRGDGLRVEASGDGRVTSLAFRHHQICFLVVPSVAEPEVERRRIALREELLQFGLVMLFEELDRAEVIAKQA